MTFSDLLNASAVSQEELARRIGVHPVTISVWKRRPPRESMAAAIALALGLDVAVVRTALQAARGGPSPAQPSPVLPSAPADVGHGRP